MSYSGVDAGTGKVRVAAEECSFVWMEGKKEKKTPQLIWFHCFVQSSRGGEYTPRVGRRGRRGAESR